MNIKVFIHRKRDPKEKELVAEFKFADLARTAIAKVEDKTVDAFDD